MEKLHSTYNEPQLMIKRENGVIDFVSNSEINIGDNLVVGYNSIERKPIVMPVQEIVSKSVSKGDFSNYSRPPFAYSVRF